MAAILNKIKMLVGAGTSAVSSGAAEGVEETMKKELCALMQKDKDEITGIVTKAIGDKITEDKTIIQPIIDAVRDMLMQSTDEIKADVTDADQAGTTLGLEPALEVPAVSMEGVPAVPVVPDVPAEGVPAVPTEGVPDVPAEGVPAVPTEGVPDVPAVPAAALSLAAIPGAAGVMDSLKSQASALPSTSGIMDSLKLQAPAIPGASGLMDSLKSQAPALPSASGLMSGLTDKIPAIPGASSALSSVANLSGATTALNAASTASSLPGVSSLANLTGATGALTAASQTIKPAENTTGGARRKTSRRKKRTLKKPKYGPRCKTLFYKNGGRKRRKTCRSRK
jgi:hypothetical protein